MTNSILKKFVLTPALLSAAAFATLTLPLALFGSKPITIQLQKEPIFQGQLRDVATPYLGLATVFSLGVGIASIAVTGWQLATRKSSQVEAQLSAIAQHLQEKEAQLEALKLSDSRLEASGLSAFIDEDLPLEQLVNTKATSPDEPPRVEPMVIISQPFETEAVDGPGVTVQSMAQNLAPAQTYMGNIQADVEEKSAHQVISLTPEELEELQNQLEQIKAQMASLQMALYKKHY
jgi:hypothetical protein